VSPASMRSTDRRERPALNASPSRERPKPSRACRTASPVPFACRVTVRHNTDMHRTEQVRTDLSSQIPAFRPARPDRAEAGLPHRISCSRGTGDRWLRRSSKPANHRLPRPSESALPNGVVGQLGPAPADVPGGALDHPALGLPVHRSVATTAEPVRGRFTPRAQMAHSCSWPGSRSVRESCARLA
jgi:hypothetical protein